MASLPKEFSSKSNVTKEQALKAIQNMDYSNSMDIPSEVIPKGFEYARADIRKPERIQGLLKKGWTFVPASRHPEMVFRAVGESDPRTADWIMFGNDLVLMERSVELCNAERAHRDKMNRDRLLTTPGLENAPYLPNIKTENYVTYDDGRQRDVSFA